MRADKDMPPIMTKDEHDELDQLRRDDWKLTKEQRLRCVSLEYIRHGEQLIWNARRDLEIKG